MGSMTVPFMLVACISCNVDDVENSPLQNENTKTFAAQIESKVNHWVSQYDYGNEITALTITPMVDDFAVIMLTEKKPDGSSFNKNLYAEKNLDVRQDSDGDDVFSERWNVGYLDENMMKVFAKKYGFDTEVEAVAKEAVGTEAAYNPQYHDSWMNNYMLWHMVYNRPMTMTRNNGIFFTQPRGYRPYAVARPLSKVTLSPRVWAIPSATKGVSSSVTSGKGSPVSSGRAASISRGGFGAGGTHAGTSNGG
jgi:hypothetical protein